MIIIPKKGGKVLNTMDSVAIDYLSGLELFSSLDQEDLEKIAGVTSSRSFKKGEIIFMEDDPGDNLFILRKGWVKILKVSPEGKEKTLAILGPGDCLGELAILDGKGRSGMAQTLTALETLQINSSDFARILKQSPHIALSLLPVLTTRLRKANREIEKLIFQDVHHRLLSYFLENGTLEGENLLVKRLPQREIASIIGTSRETISRLFGELIDRGLISIEKEFIVAKKELLRHQLGDGTFI